MKKTTSPVFTFRIEPKMRYALLLLSRVGRRSFTNTLEWLIHKAMSSDRDISEMLAASWDAEPADRFIKFATKYRWYLTFDEGRLFKHISEDKSLRSNDGVFNLVKLRQCWPALTNHYNVKDFK